MKIINAKIVTPQKIIHGSIVIENGKIKAIQTRHSGDERSEDSRIPNGSWTSPDSIGTSQDVKRAEFFDVQGKYVLPGLIEVHGHLREPGFAQKEDVPHGTRAALAGGFTTIIDMPNTNPPTTTVERLKEKREKIYGGRAYTDYAFFMGVDKNHLSELENVDLKTVVGIKVFMAGHETTPTTIPDDETLEKIFAIAQKRNLLVAIHAEDQNLINEFDKQLKTTGRTDPSLWSELRPKEVVIRAVERALHLAKKYNIRLYFLHLSTREEFDLVAEAKKEGKTVYGETVGYQLFFNTNDYKKLGNKIKVAPALRSPQDQEYLWQLVRNKMVDVVCSEHTPHEWETKNQPNVWKAQAGTPGLQETLPAFIMHWLHRFGKESIEECLMTIATLASYNPAKIFGFEKKGEIAIGKDADLVIVDMENPWTVRKSDILSKCGWSAYEGIELIGRPSTTFLIGQLVYQDKQIIGSPKGTWINKK